MDISQAIEHALDGNAVLFLGSGSSIGARNLRDNSFKTGSQFARHLAKSAGIEEDALLEDAAEEYISKFGEDKLIQELHFEFTAKEITKAHEIIAQVPWKAIFTTNYDNVMEMAYTRVGKKLQPLTLSDTIKYIARGEFSYCVHINGFIDRLNRGTLGNEFKLTDLSYLTSSLSDSPWLTKFRNDISSSRAVFFVGYSLQSDLDIRRVLYASSSLVEKCVFIIGPTPSQNTVRRASQYGTPFNISTDDLTEKIDEIKKMYSPRVVAFAGNSIAKVEMPKQQKSFSDELVFDLLLYGGYNPYYIHFSPPKNQKYFLLRSQSEELMDALSKEKIVVVHSELGNGKTMFLQGIKYRALEKGYDVFEVDRPSDAMISELDEAITKAKNPLLIVDNYHNWMDAVEYYSKNAKSNSKILLSARTSINDVLIDDLYSFFDVHDITEFSLDDVDKEEFQWINQMFNSYGLWGAKASLSVESKMKRLEWLGDFQAILLDLLKSPQMLERLNVLISNLKDKHEYHDVVLSTLILAVLNYAPSMDKLIDFWGEKVLDSRFKKNEAVQQILEVNTDEIKLRSAVFARFILRHSVDPYSTIEVLGRMAHVANDRASISPHYAHMFKNLMKFSNVQSLLPDNPKLSLFIKYYEEIKNLKKAHDRPLFWLQYAISCLVYGDFERAGKYFEDAYSYGEAQKGFDSFQIDNHYARYLLTRSTKERNWRDPFDVFYEAHTIVSRQMANERLSYPYRVARLYASFYKEYKEDLGIDQREEIVRIAKQIYSKILSQPTEKQSQKNMRECVTAMKSIITLGV